MRKKSFGSVRSFMEATDRPNCYRIGLHGEYSTNYQKFSFSGDVLSFRDGDDQISIFVLR